MLTIVCAAESVDALSQTPMPQAAGLTRSSTKFFEKGAYYHPCRREKFIPMERSGYQTHQYKSSLKRALLFHNLKTLLAF
jgi:hypothetical protein